MLFLVPLSATFAKVHDEVSLLTNLLELKFDHRFRCTFGRYECMPNFMMFISIFSAFKPNPKKNCTMDFHFWPTSQNWNLIIDLDAHWIKNHAHQLSQYFELFLPPLSITIAKPHNIVSLLNNFLELKFDLRFGFPYDRQACTQTFTMFWNICTPSKPNLSKPAERSFSFDEFLRIKIWS